MAYLTTAEGRKVSIQDITLEEAVQLCDSTEQSCETLSAEVQMFEHFVDRIVTARDHHQKRESPQTGSKLKGESAAFHRKSRAFKFSDDKFVGLSANQKYVIASKEIQELTEVNRRVIKKCDNAVNNYQAIMTEADICLCGLRKDAAQFEADIVRGAVNPFTQTVKAEKCLRYLENKLKSHESVNKKLLLKYSSIKAQEKKLLFQLDQKEQIGDVLQAVDFDQLRIVNQQYKETLSERLRDLLTLKLMAGNVLKALNLHKRKLHDLTKESKRIQSDITARADFKKRVDAEANSVQLEISQAERNNHSLRVNITKYHAPTIMEYVVAKTDVINTQSELRTWERRVQMAEVALDSYLKTWKRMKRILKC